MRREERDAVLHRGHTGTLRWMAPEVLGAVSQYTEKVRARRGAAAAEPRLECGGGGAGGPSTAVPPCTGQ